MEKAIRRYGIGGCQATERAAKKNAELQKIPDMHVLAQVVHLAVGVEAAEAKTV